MEPNDIKKFEELIPGENKESGTVIKIENNLELEDDINNQFKNPKNIKKANRWDHQIQDPPLKITLDDEGDKTNLDPFKFFTNSNYYEKGDKSYKIDIYKPIKNDDDDDDDNDKKIDTGDLMYVYNNSDGGDYPKLIAIRPRGTTQFDTEPSEFIPDGTHEYTGKFFEFNIATPIVKEWFDSINPLANAAALNFSKIVTPWGSTNSISILLKLVSFLSSFGLFIDSIVTFSK